MSAHLSLPKTSPACRWQKAAMTGLFAAATLALVSPAAACDAAIIEQPAILQIDYDPFEPARAIGRTSFTIENRSEESCAVDIALLGPDRIARNEAMVGDSGVRIRFNAGAGDAAMTPTATPGIWHIQLAAQKKHRLTLEVMVILDAIAEAGEHHQAFTMELRENGSLSADHGSSPLNLRLISLPRAQMNIAGAAGAFGHGASVSRVDFGELKSHDTRRIFLQMRANTISRLTIESANKGLLTLDKNKETSNPIRYSATLNGEEIDLRQSHQSLFDLPRTLAGTSLPFDLTIGEVGGHVAGTYSDTLTIEFSPL